MLEHYEIEIGSYSPEFGDCIHSRTYHLATKDEVNSIAKRKFAEYMGEEYKGYINRDGLWTCSVSHDVYEFCCKIS